MSYLLFSGIKSMKSTSCEPLYDLILNFCDTFSFIFCLYFLNFLGFIGWFFRRFIWWKLNRWNSLAGWLYGVFIERLADLRFPFIQHIFFRKLRRNYWIWMKRWAWLFFRKKYFSGGFRGFMRKNLYIWSRMRILELWRA